MGRIVTSNTPVLLDLGLSSEATSEETSIVSACITRAEAAVRRFLGYDPVQVARTEYYPRQDYAKLYSQTVMEVNDTVAYERQTSQGATDLLQLQHLPIRGTPAIDLRVDYDARSGTRSGAFGAETVKTEGTDYWPNYGGVDDNGNRICQDGIIRSIGLWPTVAGTVRVVYTAGYSVAEFTGSGILVDAYPIYEAVIDEAAVRAKRILSTKKSSRVGFVPGQVTGEHMGDYSYSITVDKSLASQESGDLLPRTKQRLWGFVNLGTMLGG